MGADQTILVTLILYKVMLLAIGYWASKRIHSEKDFFLAGQGLGAWTAGLSYAASTSSAWVLLGFTGAVYSQGMVALWLVPGIFMGYIITWLIIGPRLNDETRSKQFITIIDFVTDGMTPQIKRVTGIVCAVMILFCFVFYISAQFQAAGNAFTSAFDMGAAKAIILGAVIIVLYCFLGGFWAASITDTIQAGVMLVACIIVPVATLNAAGGTSAFVQSLGQIQDPDWFRLTGQSTGFVGVGVALGMFGTGLGALGQPQLLNRIMAAKSHRARVQGAAITICWGLVVYSGLVCLALSARSLSLDTGGESLFFAAAQAFLPTVLAGIVIAAVLSAVMSTVDSLLLAAASAVSRDMGFGYATPARALWAGRMAMLGVAVVAVFMTLFLPKDIFSRVLFAWVALGAAFGPTILTKALGLRVKPRWTLVAVLAGFTVAVTAYNIDGGVAEFFEKWVSWGIGLMILLAGRVPDKDAYDNSILDIETKSVSAKNIRGKYSRENDHATD